MAQLDFHAIARHLVPVHRVLGGVQRTPYRMEGNGAIGRHDERAACSSEVLAARFGPRSVGRCCIGGGLRSGALQAGSIIGNGPADELVAVALNVGGARKLDGQAGGHVVQRHGSTRGLLRVAGNGSGRAVCPLRTLARAKVERDRIGLRLVVQAQNRVAGAGNALARLGLVVARECSVLGQIPSRIAISNEGEAGDCRVVLRDPRLGFGECSSAFGVSRISDGSLVRHALVPDAVDVSVAILAGSFSLSSFQRSVRLYGAVSVQYQASVSLQRHNHAIARHNPTLDEVFGVEVASPYGVQRDGIVRRNFIRAAGIREGLAGSGVALEVFHGLGCVSRQRRIDTRRVVHADVAIIYMHCRQIVPTDERGSDTVVRHAICVGKDNRLVRRVRRIRRAAIHPCAKANLELHFMHVGLPHGVQRHSAVVCIKHRQLELSTRGHEACAAIRPVARDVVARGKHRSCRLRVIGDRVLTIGLPRPTNERVTRALDVVTVGQCNLLLRQVVIATRVSRPRRVRAAIENQFHGIRQIVQMQFGSRQAHDLGASNGGHCGTGSRAGLGHGVARRACGLVV